MVATNGDAPPGVPRQLTENERFQHEVREHARDYLRTQQELVTNLTNISRQWLTTQADPRRNLFDECGYPGDTSTSNAAGLTTDLYRALYEREPVATRVVELMPKECWQATPTVFEDWDSQVVTPFEEAWDALGTQLRGERCWYQDESGSPIWEYLLRADILSGIGHFGVLLLGIDDGKDLQEPLAGVMASGDGPMTTDEEKLLRDPKPRWQAGEGLGKGRGVPTRTDALGATPLSNEQVLAVNSWAAERSKEWTLNASGMYQRRTKQRDRGFHVDPREPSATRARASDGSDVLGVDEQYDEFAQGMGMSPVGGDPAGTDSQYFGPQIGSSEFGATAETASAADSEPTDASDAEPARPKLIFLRPYDESLVQIVRYEWNIRNPRFGMPVMYRITLNDPREMHSGVGLPLATVFVHWTRVIHLADNRRSSEIFGVPRQRPVLNPILDIQKVRGASAEGYYKSCFTGLQFSTHPQLGGDVLVDEDKVRDSVEIYQNGLTRALLAKGGQWSTIAPSVVPPGPFIDVNIEAICIQLGCPVPVFKGYEIGEQASTNNAVEWNKRKYERQNNYLTPRVIVLLADRLIQCRVLPEPGSAKSRVDNLRRTQPWARVVRRAKGWLCTNVRRGDGSSVVARLRRIARRIADIPGAMPGYGELYWDQSTRTAWYVGGDGDEPSFYKAVRTLLGSIPGVARVRYEAESYPPEGASYELVSNAEDGEAPVPAARTSTVFLADGGYSTEWPDVEAMSKKDKAALAVQYTQALAAYIAGNCEQYMPFKDYLVNVWGWSDELAQDMVEAAKAGHDDLIAPPVPVAPPGGGFGGGKFGGAKPGAPKPAQQPTEPKPPKPPGVPNDERAD